MEEWCCGGGEPEFVLGANLEQEVWAVQGAATQVTVPLSIAVAIRGIMEDMSIYNMTQTQICL